MKSAKIMLVLLAAVSAVMLKAEIRSWDFSNPAIWKEGNPGGLNHDFGSLAQITSEGMQFCLDSKDHRIWFSNISEELNQAKFVEVYHRGGSMIYGFYCYGAGESGFEAARRHNSSWTRNDRFYPERHIVPVGSIERWRKGGVKRACFAFASSGKGQDGIIHSMVFRRGKDTLANGALMIKTKNNQPAFWNFSGKARAARDTNFGMMVCKMDAGTAKTDLTSLKPGNKYTASFYSSVAPAAEIVIYNRAGKVVFKQPFKASGAKYDQYSEYKLEYVVPEKAFRGDLVITFRQKGAFGDVLVEDQGGAKTWSADWIWTPEGFSVSQNCYFRREFKINDPNEIKEAFLQATCDDAFTLEVNNVRIMNYNNWSAPQTADVAKHLKAGKNVITASGHNGTGKAGFIAELKLTRRFGKPEIIKTDASWLCKTGNPGENWRRTELPDNARDGWKPAMEMGRPPVGPWGTNVKYYDSMPKPGKQKPLYKNQFAARKTKAVINRDLSFPRIEINNKIADPVIYGIRWRGDRTNTYKTIQASDFKLFRLMWEFSFEAWGADGKVNYSDLDRAVEEFLRSVPDGKIILVMRISAPPWWIKQNEGEMILYSDNKYTGADGTFASPASVKWRNDVNSKLNEVIRHIESSWYASAIAGYMPCNLRGPEWVVPARHKIYPDYSKPMQKYFKEYLREKYNNNVDELRKAWKNNTVTFETAAIPKQELRQLQTGYFLSDERQDVMDYNRAASRANVDTIASVMDTIKAAAPEKLRVLYFGYLMTLNHISANPSVAAHYDLSRLLDMKKVDVFCSPISYVWRKPGDISGVGSVETSFRKNGVVWMQEADNRTFLTAQDDHAVTYNPVASLKENWREFIYAMVKREPVWFYDLGGDWYNNSVFHDDFRQMHKIYRRVINEEITWQTPVALFYDEKSCDGVSLTKGDWGSLRPFVMAAEIQRMAALCGMPYDMYELDDIYDLDLSKYKVLYFQNAWRYDPKFAKFLQEKVYPAGKTVIWIYAAGYGQKGGLAGMKEYTGFDFEALPLGNALYYKSVDGRMIGYPGMKGTETFAVKGRSNALGIYENGKTAAAWKKIGKGASFYFAAHDKNGWLMRKALEHAGVKPLVDRSDRVVYDGRNFGLIAVDGPGVRTVTLPGGDIARVVDLINGKDVKFEGSSFKVFAAPGDAMLFRVEFK